MGREEERKCITGSPSKYCFIKLVHVWTEPQHKMHFLLQFEVRKDGSKCTALGECIYTEVGFLGKSKLKGG